MPELDLFLHEERVGVVTPVPRDSARVALQVDPAYRQEILLSESFATFPGSRPDSVAVSNLLGGYVPEGDHRARMAAKRRIDEGDLFALLSEFGGSIAGAITLRPRGEASPYRPSYQPLNDRELAIRLRQALDDSDQGIPGDSRSTLPGYQPKVLAAFLNGSWASPHGRAPSTHILKPQVPSRPHRIFDEHYSHLLTKQIGISRYDSQMHRAGRMTYLAIERFDRAVEGERVRTLHQEDLAQALGLNWRNPDAKFQDPAWPTDQRRASVRRIGELLGSIPGGGAAVDAWIRQLTYSLAIGDNDAHAKNVALMHRSTGSELSEIYDALPNLFQDELVKWDLALAIDGTFDHRKISVPRILAEVASWGVAREAHASDIVTSTLNAVNDALRTVDPPAGMSPGLRERLQWNVDRLLAGAEISTPKS